MAKEQFYIYTGVFEGFKTRISKSELLALHPEHREEYISETDMAKNVSEVTKANELIDQDEDYDQDEHGEDYDWEIGPDYDPNYEDPDIGR